MKAGTALILSIFLAGVLVGQGYIHAKEEWQAQLVQADQRDDARFRKIQRKHGAVAVATDWSHALRLNGEVIRLKRGDL
jgi:hypothetical protein